MPIPAAIRRAVTSDATAIEALIHRYVASGTLLPRTVEFIAERSPDFLVAEVGERVVGCVHLEDYSPSLAEVRSLVVDPAWQGRGIGAALVRALEELARMREYPIVFAVSNNVEFFLSQGYVPREIPELDRERSEVSKFKGVFAKDLQAPVHSGGPSGA
jgi:amino-acid N-acetyltransferase